MPLLGPAQIRQLADIAGIRPTKTLGQNFVHDGGTVRRIVRDAGVGPADRVLEIGPGLGSLTLALLEAGAVVSAVEIDPPLAALLPQTVAQYAPQDNERFAVCQADALRITPEQFAVPKACYQAAESASTARETGVTHHFDPQFLVANLPYNVAVPVLLRLIELCPTINRVTVMVQMEVAQRLAASPGSRVYGVPSAKAAWDMEVRQGAKISRSVFWPIPNVDSALVHLERRATPRPERLRESTFRVIDAAFAQRRKTLRAALSSWAGSAQRAEEILVQAGIDPSVRGERLGVDDFMAIAHTADALGNANSLP
ncbi:16S rRNA (adenine(1518)-N(6)/adenine(1519)-N(6))-dimethyltransferase RsmA [Trueperella sp. LYQ141]|uniref:16S rRNA (adenine(1518)-N(6)/adenine(1519)-N(6))- dimethyltransferase RsmA n=1 Tax=Trueperella sp. LYQ141 TaxID=3391058 RepID=UPI00398396CB